MWQKITKLGGCTARRLPMAPSKFSDFMPHSSRSIYNLTRRSPRKVTNVMEQGSMKTRVTFLPCVRSSRRFGQIELSTSSWARREGAGRRKVKYVI